MGGAGSGGKRGGSFRATAALGTGIPPASGAEDVNAIEPPAWLTGPARDAFIRLRDRLAAERLVSARDVGSVCAVAVIETVVAQLAAGPELSQGDRNELRQWIALYRLALGDLGGTPASRSRVAPVPPPPEEDPFEVFLRDPI